MRAVTERPVLFSAPMVLALLAGTKTQTRRVVKARHRRGVVVALSPDGYPIESVADIGTRLVPCPYGMPGGRLWVRETFVERSGDLFYRADADAVAGYEVTFGEPVKRWTPAIHMPRDASRITLEVTNVRVERLQAISSRDAIAEGIEACPRGGEWRDYLNPRRDTLTPRSCYRTLWESINGAGSWDANPWVWVVEFKRA